jgi:hypothetical protein
MMRAILTETLDVLENDLFFAALVPMHRQLFIEDVIFNAKGSVRSYDFHFPSSYQHYKQMKLVDTRALNGFVVRKGRELSKPTPINECVTGFHSTASPPRQSLFLQPTAASTELKKIKRRDQKISRQEKKSNYFNKECLWMSFQRFT